MNDLISIIIVNFKVGHLLQECIKSITEQQVDVEVVIIDNNSGDNDRRILVTMEHVSPFLKIIYNENNRGFSAANNQGLAVCRGNYIVFLNPDTFLFPSCLGRLVSFLKIRRGIGCVTPKLWMDKEKTFLLPPSSLPTISEFAQSRLSAKHYLFLHIQRKKWLQNAIAFWNSMVPMPVSAVSGAFLMTERSVLDRIGHFDERFPLYFEDSDLCMRMKKAGMKLWYIPDAEAVHYYNQSAKSAPESVQKFAYSERLYVEKYYSRLGARYLSLLNSLPAARNRSFCTPASFSSPIKTSRGNYLLFSPLKTMIPSAAHKVTSEQFTFDHQFVDKLSRGIYYSALVSQHGKILQQFVLEKT